MKSLIGFGLVALAFLAAPIVALAGDCRTVQNVVVQEVPAVTQYVAPQVVQRVIVQQPQYVQRVIVQQPQIVERVIVQQNYGYGGAQAFSSGRQFQSQRVIVQDNGGGFGRQRQRQGFGGGGGGGNVLNQLLSPQGVLTIGGAALGASVAGPLGAPAGAAIGAAAGQIIGGGLNR